MDPNIVGVTGSLACCQISLDDQLLIAADAYVIEAKRLV